MGGPRLEAERDARARRADSIEANALAHYIHRGHHYRMALRSSIAMPYLEQGQYMFFVRIDASDEFWRIHAELKRRYEERG